MSEQLYNYYSDLVAGGGYTAASGVLNIQGSTSGFTAPFHIGIYNAAAPFALIVLLKVTGVNSSTQYAVTAETGHNSPADTSAAANSLVAGSITAAAMAQIKLDAFQRGVNTVSFSATPAFDLSLGDQLIVLTGNVTSSTLTNLLPGNRVTFCIEQDASGGHTFVWPAAVKGGMAIGTTLSKANLQEFWSPDGTTLYALNPGIINQ